jgi:hypothetical protein
MQALSRAAGGQGKKGASVLKGLTGTELGLTWVKKKRWAVAVGMAIPYAHCRLLISKGAGRGGGGGGVIHGGAAGL